MSERISTTVASRLNGDSPGTYRAALSQYLTKMGAKEGSERKLSFEETVALRALTELSSAKLALKEASKRALDLMPYIRDITAGKLGVDANGRPQFVFAIEMWGYAEGEYRRAGRIADGMEQLADCVKQAALGAWPNIKILNLTAIVAETNAGWDIALYGSDEAAERLKARIAKKPPEQQQWAWSLFSELEKRLDPFGGRRPTPPSNVEWAEIAPIAA
jgi:hypothetical protein